MKLSEAIKKLSEAGIDSARHDAREVFMHFGGFTWENLISGDAACDSPELAYAIERRSARYPLQYIIGKTWFYREEYFVSEDCLIPRPDTEILVDYAVKHIRRGAVFADLCTGSGCVGISVLKNTEGTRALLADISDGALAVAARNAAHNGVAERAEIRRMDVMAEVPEEKFFAVLSNPPYVSDSAYRELEAEIYHEPRLAFVGGDDGADFYRRLTPIYKEKIEKDGFIAYEIGYDQGEILIEIARECGMRCEIIKDIGGGNDRVAILRL